MSNSGTFVLDLAAIDATMLPSVGGKAANLGELIGAGLPVPHGFCVTTEAYSQVAASASIDFAAFGSARLDELERLAGHAREALLAAPVPSVIRESIIKAYNRLGPDTPVAVRSSATAEDLPFASFAGQQDTYLNIVGTDAVLNAVQRCWSSLWTERAVVYRKTNGIDHSSVTLAVVVQQMVEADKAGVMFTANPVTGRRRQAVIDASPGLGEAVVSGAVNPDHFVVEADTGEIVERRLGDKRFEVRSMPGGGTQHVERRAGSDHACITDDQVRALTNLGTRVEALYGAPQDTEWAIDREGTLWLTQARPITTLFPLPTRSVERAADFRVYFCFSVAQGLYRPLTPMGLAAIRLVASSGARLLGIRVDDPHAGPPVYAEAGQRLFVDLTSTLRGRMGRVLMPRVLDVMEARSATILRRLCEDPRLSITQRSRWPSVRRVLRIMFRYGVPLKVMNAVFRPEAARARIKRYASELAGRLELPAGVDSVQRLEFIEHVLGTEVVPLMPNAGPAAAVGLGMIALTSKLLGDDASAGELQTVLRGIPHNITTEMDLALWHLATSIRAEASAAQVLLDTPAAQLTSLFRSGFLPPVAQRGLEQFLAVYGHRAVAEIDIGLPRWSDDPTHILGVLANYLRLENSEMAPDALFARGAAEAEDMVEVLSARARRRGWIRGRLVRFALERARQLAGVREIPKYYVIFVISAVRRELTRIGAQLAQRGRIQNADDIFFLDLADVRAALGGRDMGVAVAERRQAYEMEMRRRHVPRVLLSDGTEPEMQMAGAVTDAVLTGTPASPGTVTGIARVILDPVGAHLEPGEILVAPSTDPGWTPLFLTAGGLVMEMGGANSHGAVVAREYGIPAVVGVPDATVRIHTGQRIVVDGAAGAISFPPAEAAGQIAAR